MWPSALGQKSPRCSPAPRCRSLARPVFRQVFCPGFSILPKKVARAKKILALAQQKSRPVRPGPAKYFSLPIPDWAHYFFKPSLSTKTWLSKYNPPSYHIFWRQLASKRFAISGVKKHKLYYKPSKLFFPLINHMLLKANLLDKIFCRDLRDDWLPLFTLFSQPHFDDAPFASKNGAREVYCSYYLFN
jgi:hypothetical protein